MFVSCVRCVFVQVADSVIQKPQSRWPVASQEKTSGSYVRNVLGPIPVAARSKAALLLGLWVRIPPEAWMFVVSILCCKVEVSATN